jgi:hypothetical protein
MLVALENYPWKQYPQPPWHFGTITGAVTNWAGGSPGYGLSTAVAGWIAGEGWTQARLVNGVELIRGEVLELFFVAKEPAGGMPKVRPIGGTVTPFTASFLFGQNGEAAPVRVVRVYYFSPSGDPGQGATSGDGWLEIQLYPHANQTQWVGGDPVLDISRPPRSLQQAPAPSEGAESGGGETFKQE